jgi:NADPH:quinone reductase-like Zn-dependent oxidoreductase
MGTQLEKPDVYDTISQMLKWAAAGTVKVVVDRTFPLDAAAEAHAYAENNSILGRVVLLPSG